MNKAFLRPWLLCGFLYGVGFYGYADMGEGTLKTQNSSAASENMKTWVTEIHTPTPKMEKTRRWGLGLGMDTRWTLSPNGRDYQDFLAGSIQGHYAWSQWQYHMSGARYVSGQSQTGAVSIQSLTYEWMNWGRYMVWGNKLRLFAGVGAGLRQTQVQTQLGSSLVRHNGDLTPQAGLELGLQSRELANLPWLYWEGQLRSLLSLYRDQPTWALGLAIGWRP